MTDKEQIIIDGVDVSECIFLDIVNERLWCDNVNISAIGKSQCPYVDCFKNPDCYYKQRARKTQECEALKKRNKDNERFYLNQYAKKDSEVLDLTHKLNVKTQECEELNKEKAEIKKYLGISEKTIMQRLEELTERKIEMQISDYSKEQELSRYRKALEEIENFMNYEFSGQNEWVKTSILDIINNAKGEGTENE